MRILICPRAALSVTGREFHSASHEASPCVVQKESLFRDSTRECRIYWKIVVPSVPNPNRAHCTPYLQFKQKEHIHAEVHFSTRCRIRFDFLAEHYLGADFGVDAVRPKSVNTISHVEQIVRAYLIPRFGNEIAKDIKSLDIQRWLKGKK